MAHKIEGRLRLGGRATEAGMKGDALSTASGLAWWAGLHRRLGLCCCTAAQKVTDLPLPFAPASACDSCEEWFCILRLKSGVPD